MEKAVKISSRLPVLEVHNLISFLVQKLKAPFIFKCRIVRNYNFLVITYSITGGMASNQTATSSQKGALSGTFGPSRLLDVPKPRAGISKGKYAFM